MRVAVLTLTRDRLAYTQHCFATLAECAGCVYDHYVLDQGSSDGTWEWLAQDYRRAQCLRVSENIGIHAGFNRLLDAASREQYDAVVTFDNDCELIMRDTLRDVCELAVAGNAILSPRIQGLRQPPAPIGEYVIDGDLVDEVPIMGAIFRAAPAHVFDDDGFRFKEAQPFWGGDEQTISGWAREHGMRLGYVRRLAANHYETTDGQHARFPEYFARTLAEGKPAL